MIFLGILFNNRNFLDLASKALAALLVIFVISPLHECAHGWVAYKLGDRTAKYSGRLTLNPMAHFDLVGAIGIFLFGIGWAKPVPVNPHNFKNPKSGMALTALAGPVSNFLAAFFGCIIFNVMSLFLKGINGGILAVILSVFLSYFIQINVGLGVFNLIPVPPLDGSRIIAFFLSEDAMEVFYRYQRELSLGLLILVATGVLNGPIFAVQSFFLKGIVWLASLPFGG